jgi:hypothetical protein
MRTIDGVLTRLRAEFVEMPGLLLTAAQVQRLCGVEPAMCQVVLDALVDARFLYVKPDGTYGRLVDGERLPRQAVKSNVRRSEHLVRAS